MIEGDGDGPHGQADEGGGAATGWGGAGFGPDDGLLVEQMVEPVVMGPQGLLRPGTMLLRKMQP